MPVPCQIGELRAPPQDEGHATAGGKWHAGGRDSRSDGGTRVRQCGRRAGTGRSSDAQEETNRGAPVRLALDQAADLLARPDRMYAADRACDRYLHKAAARAHALWDAVARRVDAARPDSVEASLSPHREERREEQQRLQEQERRAEQECREMMERRQVTQKLVAESRRRKHEATDKRRTDARRVVVAAGQETWERGRQLAFSTRSRRRRRHHH